jgi:lipopolysaccharide/colanic/teichoic acid biosynthesis glycosyltransferase
MVIDMLRKWEDLPKWMKTEEVRPYYDILSRKEGSLKAKRLFDVSVAAFMLVLLLVPMFLIAVLIVMDSPGGVFYRQERVTAYGKKFQIHKFRTMVADADKTGACVTAGNDSRITGIGGVLRKYRLDEIPQLIDILEGNMSFVGTRPEAVRYVKSYTKEMCATLLLPAGITSEASIRYKDEAKLLDEARDVDETYITQVLPAKMAYNLESIRRFSLPGDIATMFRTVFAVFGK